MNRLDRFIDGVLWACVVGIAFALVVVIVYVITHWSC